MKNKYDISILTSIVVFPSSSRTPISVTKDLAEKLAEGFDIYSAIPFSASECAGIQYILRKENE